MKAKSFAGMRCSVAGALEMIGDRWTLLLLRDLGMGLSRFDEFQSSTGIANTTLATRLRNLERNGIIARTRYLERPPRDAYHLTDKGRDFWNGETDGTPRGSARRLLKWSTRTPIANFGWLWSIRRQVKPWAATASGIALGPARTIACARFCNAPPLEAHHERRRRKAPGARYWSWARNRRLTGQALH